MHGPHRRRRALAVAVVAGLVLAVAACGGSGDDGGDAEGAGGAAAGGGASGPWEFTDDQGTTHRLDEVPDTIVAQSVSAGGLWEYGIEVAGVFGPLRRADGTPDPAIGLADPDEFESLGEVDGQINVEALAALRPDIIVTTMWGEDSYWGIDDGSLDTLREIAPIVGIRVEDRPMDEPLARMADLAESLGADPDSGDLAEAHAAFEVASDGLGEALAAKPGLQALAASGSQSELYVAYPPGFGDLAYYQGLGMDLVEPAEHPAAGGYWETLAWEEVDTYPADLILVDVRYAAIDELLDMAPAIVATLPAAEADQMIPWPAAYALGYGSVAANIEDLTASVEAASPDVV